jgi:hypothetical protein
MRYFVLAFTAALLCAQDVSRQALTTYTYDLNGRRIPSAASVAVTSAAGSLRAETTQTVNGRTVPLEALEEKVISQGPEGRVVERVVRRYDTNGRAVEGEKIRIEERAEPGGGTTVLTTVLEPDINGRYSVRERSTTRSAKFGETLNAETLVERPNLSGSLELFEKRRAVQTGNEKNLLTDVTIYRRDANGGLMQTERVTTETVVENSQTTQTTATYNSNTTGTLDLAGQRVSRLRRNPDGSEVEVVDLFGGSPAGRSPEPSGRPALREQQIIERRPVGGQGLVETFSVRRPNLESGRLGPAQKISETVCTGKCLPEAPAPAKP